MESLLKKIKENRGVKDSTLKIYKRYLNKLSNAINKKDFENINFYLTKKKEILEFLKDKSESTKKNYIASILVSISPKEKRNPPEKYKEVYNLFKNTLLSEHNKYNQRIETRVKSKKQEENWMEWEEILKFQRKLGNNIKKLGYRQGTKELFKRKDKSLIQEYLILSLYTLLATRRLEYSLTKIIKYGAFQKLSDDEKDNNVYLVILSRTKKFFSFGKNVIKSKTKENVKIDVNKNLNSVINLWLNFNTHDYLLVDKNGNQLTKNGLSKLLRKIFKPFGKKIGATLLRTIRISSNLNPEYEDKKKELAKKMNHSVNMQSSVYLKK